MSTNMLIFTHQQTCLILSPVFVSLLQSQIISPVFVSLLQSQIIAFAEKVQILHAIALDRTFVEQKSKPTVYNHNNVPGKFSPNSSRRTSLHWGRWLTNINTPLFISYIRCFPPQWKCNVPRKTAGINNHIAMSKSDKCHRYGS